VWQLQPDIADRELSPFAWEQFTPAPVSSGRRASVDSVASTKKIVAASARMYLWLQLMLHYPFVRSFEVSAWYHTDASDLGLSSGRRDFPLEPVFTAPGPIRSACPRELLEPLERWLALHALARPHVRRPRRSRRIARSSSAFRVRREPRSDLASAWLKLRAPRLSRLLRSCIKRLDLGRTAGVSE
jgi:hypothetical protein